MARRLTAQLFGVLVAMAVGWPALAAAQPEGTRVVLAPLPCEEGPLAAAQLEPLLRLELVTAGVQAVRPSDEPDQPDLRLRVGIDDCAAPARADIQVQDVETGETSASAVVELGADVEVLPITLALAVAERLGGLLETATQAIEAREAQRVSAAAEDEAATVTVTRVERGAEPPEPPRAEPLRIAPWVAADLNGFVETSSWFFGGRLGLMVDPPALPGWWVGGDAGFSYTRRDTNAGRVHVYLPTASAGIGPRARIGSSSTTIGFLVRGELGYAAAVAPSNREVTRNDGVFAAVGVWLRVTAALADRVSVLFDLLAGVALNGLSVCATSVDDAPCPDEDVQLSTRGPRLGFRAGAAF